MNKIVIPRCQSTIKYIILELEEIAREELFRIKIIKKKKARAAEQQKLKNVDVELCPICNKPIEGEDEKTGKRLGSSSAAKVHDHKTKPAPTPTVVRTPQETPKPTPKVTPRPTPPPPIAPTQNAAVVKPSPVLKSVKSTPPPPPPAQPVPTVLPRKADSVKEIFKPPSLRTMAEPNCNQYLLSTEEPTRNDRLDHLKMLLTEIIGLGKYMVESGADKLNMEEFLNVCDEAKNRIDKFLETEDEATSDIDENLKDRLEHLKLHLREVIDLTQNFRNEAILSTSMEHFLETCEAVDEKLDVYVKTSESKPIGDDTKARLLYLKQQIKDVVEMTQDYKAQGLLTPSVEDFVKTCASVQLKIDEYTSDQGTNINVERIGHLKDHVGELEKLTTDIKHDGLATSSFEKFMLSCKDFKVRLEEYKKKAKKPPRPLYDGDISKLVEQLEETIDLSMLAKEEGLIDESVDDFVKTCQNIKKLIASKEEVEEKPQTLGELKSNIGGVIQLIKDLKAEGMIAESVEDFLETCEMTRNKIEVYERYPLQTNKPGRKAEQRCTGNCTSTCVGTCNCDADKEEAADEDAICDKCMELENEPIPPVLPYAAEPCDLCRGIIKLEDEEEPYPCDSCTRPPEPKLCIHCKKNIDEEEFPEIHTAEGPCPPPTPPEPETPPPPPAPVDSSLGYFEKKIRKIVRVTRTMNEDGTIREETETIIIRKNRHDPTSTSLMDDDDDNEEEVTDLPDDEDDTCAMFASVRPNIGFLRKSKSEGIIRLIPMVTPNLRQCLSTDKNMIKGNSFSDYSFEVVTSMQSLDHSQNISSFIAN